MATARQEATVRVVLDTTKARAELRGLTKQAQQTGGRVGAGIRRAVGKGLGAAGMGAFFAGGMGAAKSVIGGSLISGAGDIISETFGAFGQKLNDLFLGDMDDNSRARKYARDHIYQTYRGVTASTGITAGMISHFHAVKDVQKPIEVGGSIIRGYTAFYKDKDATGLVEKITAAITQGLADAVDNIIRFLKSPYKFVTGG